MDGYRHIPATLSQEITQYALYRRLGMSEGRSGWVRKVLVYRGLILEPHATLPSIIYSGY